MQPPYTTTSGDDGGDRGWPRAAGAGALRLLAALALVLVLVAPGAPAVAGDPFVVIVNPSVPGSVVRRDVLAAVFLKKAVRWGDGSPATPIDQSGTSPVRRAFSETVFQMPVVAVLQYWQKQLLTATTPLRVPSVKGSDEEVLAFVATTAGSVGYVSTGATVPSNVKVVRLVD
jgi:ABC-type phosphate transport system substrate-binding protein